MAPPNHVAALNGKFPKLFGVEVFVVLRVWVPANEVADIHNGSCPIVEDQANFHISCIGSIHYVQSFLHFLQFGGDVCTSHLLFHHKELHPFTDDVFVVFSDKSLNGTLVFRQQRIYTTLLSNIDAHQLTIHHYQFKDAFLVSMLDMHMNRFVFV